MDYCCEIMKGQVEFTCADHPNLNDCPDSLVAYWEPNLVFGLRVHDGGSSVIEISFCPWCGSKLHD